MKQRVLLGVLSLGCIILAGISYFVYFRLDRKAPIIHVEKQDITYKEGDDMEILLEGVTAEDDRDGDISDQVFVDQIIELPDVEGAKSDQAIVKYAVIDQAKNIGTAKRSITYISNGDENSDELETAGNDGTEAMLKDESVKQEPEKEELLPNGESPAIRLTTNTLTVAAGADFDTMSVIENAVDDVDDRETVYAGIHLEGVYDTTVPGSYTLQYYVLDSDGNQSNIEDFILVVQ